MKMKVGDWQNFVSTWSVISALAVDAIEFARDSAHHKHVLEAKCRPLFGFVNQGSGIRGQRKRLPLRTRQPSPMRDFDGRVRSPGWREDMGRKRHCRCMCKKCIYRTVKRDGESVDVAPTHDCGFVACAGLHLVDRRTRRDTRKKATVE